MTRTTPEPDATEHTLIHTICDQCDEEDLLTISEHPRDSDQTQAVVDAHHKVAEGHAGETGHHVEVGQSAGDPESIIELAESLAASVGGIEPEALSREIRTIK